MVVGGGKVCNLPEGDAPQPIGPIAPAEISATCVGRAVVRVLLCVVLTAICEPQQPYTCVRVSVCVLRFNSRRQTIDMVIDS